nr:MAG TPA: hypothetical protein [Caudoviricetes sp.]
MKVLFIGHHPLRKKKKVILLINFILQQKQ